jgi:phosphoglycolate phosphatase
VPLLVTDLDNTLYDWVTPFARAIRALVRELAPVLGVGEERIQAELKVVHRRHHNSEHPFACFEIPSVRRRFPGATPEELLTELAVPLAAFDAARSTWLRLFDGVSDTLDALRAGGVVIVGHTEAIGPIARSRLRALGIDRAFASVYCIESQLPPHPSPEHEASAALTLYPVPRADRKPNPQLLRDICASEGARLSQSAYVGDSLVRDVWMARRAGVTAIWARYGQCWSEEDWATVVKVSHWTADDVRRELRLRESARGVRPDYAIASFRELLSIVPAVGARRVSRRRAVG